MNSPQFPDLSSAHFGEKGRSRLTARWDLCTFPDATAKPQSRTGTWWHCAVMKRTVILFSIVYSLMRYAWANEVPVQNWPAFIGNKALAFSAVSFLALGFWHYSSQRDQAIAYFRSALIAAVAHGFISAGLLQSSYYEFLHADSGRLNAYGELTLLFGGLAIALLFSRIARSAPASTALVDRWLLAVLIGHVVSVGVLKWLAPSSWAYGLVPISLLSFLVLLCSVGGQLRGHASSANPSAGDGTLADPRQSADGGAAKEP